MNNWFKPFFFEVKLSSMIQTWSYYLLCTEKKNTHIQEFTF